MANITSSNSTSFSTYFAVNQETAAAELLDPANQEWEGSPTLDKEKELVSAIDTALANTTVIPENLEGEKIMQKQTLIQEAVTPVQEQATTAAHKANKPVKSKPELIEVDGIGQIFAKGNQQILDAYLVSMCISNSADENGKAEMGKMAQELAEQGYDMIFSGVRKEDLWGINAALQHGARVVIFSHEGINLLMKNPAIPAFKEAFEQGNVLFLSFSLNEKYSLQNAQKRNDAVVKLCSSTFVAQALASQKVSNGKKIWDGKGAWDLIQRFQAAGKTVFIPMWNEDMPASMAVIYRKFSVIEVSDAQEIAHDLVQRMRQAQAMENL